MKLTRHNSGDRRRREAEETRGHRVSTRNFVGFRRIEVPRSFDRQYVNLLKNWKLSLLLRLSLAVDALGEVLGALVPNARFETVLIPVESHRNSGKMTAEILAAERFLLRPAVRAS